MQDPHSLMRPLGSDSLKPRAFSQAAQSAPTAPTASPAPERTFMVPELPLVTLRPEPAPAPEAKETADIPVQDDSSPEEILPIEETEEEPEQEPEEAQEEPEESSESTDTLIASLLSICDEEPSKPQGVGGTIADILAGTDDDDDDDDGFDDEPMLPVHPDRPFYPQPVFVPLDDEPAPPRRKSGWKWFFLLLLAAAAGYAGWMLLK